MTDAETVLSSQLDKPPGESKKFAMAKFGTYAILGVFVASAIVFLVKPETAGQVVILSQIVVGSIAGIVGIYLGAQGYVEQKNSSSLASVVESKKSEERIEHVNTTRTEGGAKAYADDIE